uniref:Uncharacterized protein n=1 Tax=Lotus japonicus TaxID=34305 RepID=I3S0D5_LOTJA|nr:unknown [Lotus japonicus]
MIFKREGFFVAYNFHSSSSIFPSPFVSTSFIDFSTMDSTSSSGTVTSDSVKIAKTISFNSLYSMYPVRRRSNNLNANSIFFSSGVFG